MWNGIYSGNWGQFSLVVIILGIIDVVLRGMGMWQAAKHNQRNWFIALLIVNSAGILPTIYLKFFQKKKKKG